MKSRKTVEKLKKLIKDNMDLIIILGITAIIVIITGENLVKRIGPSENTFGLEWVAEIGGIS